MLKHRLVIVTLIALFFTTPLPALAGVKTLTPKLAVTEEYTDNQFLTNSDRQAQFSTIISPGFDFSAQAPQMRLNASYTAGYTIYSDSEVDPFLRHNASISMRKDFTKHTSASFGNFFLWTDEPVQKTDFVLLGYVEYEDQLLPVLDTTLRTGLNEYMTNTATANVTHQFGEKNSIALNGLFSLRNEIDSDYDNDNRRYRPSLDLTWWMTPSSGLDFSAAYTRGIFEASSDFDDLQGALKLRQQLTRIMEMFFQYKHTLRRYMEQEQTDYNYYDGSMGFSFQGETISLTLGAGYFFQDFLERGKNEDFYFNGSIDKSWSSPRTTAHLVGAAGLERNEFGSENLGLEQFYSLGTTINHRLTPRMTASLNASFRISDSIDTDYDRTTYRGIAGGSLSYVIRPWVSVSTSYRYNILRGRGSGNYDENVARLTVSFTPQGWRYN